VNPSDDIVTLMACLGAETVSVRTTEYMERCRACGTEIQYQLVDHPFWGFRAGCEEVENMTERLGDAPIEAEYIEKMNAVAVTLDQLFNGDAHGADRKVGFMLMLFPFGELGRCNYISNGADRKDIVTLFKEFIARFEGQTGNGSGE
jgi:hypothetical protein